MTELINILKTLKQNDPKLGKVIELINPKYHKRDNDPFISLVKIIIGQQLSSSAAKTIFTKFENCFKDKKITPEAVSFISNEEIRQCGISRGKSNYIKGLTEILINNPKYFENLKKYDDFQILQELCKIKGIGIWTASIFMMGTLDHENIFPYGDVTLIKAIRNIYGENIKIDNVISLWYPYKSFACRILWQWVDKGMPKIS